MVIMPHKGFSPTEETRRKLSEAMKGKKNALGYKQTEEHRRKSSESRKGQKRSWEARGRMHQAQIARRERDGTRRIDDGY